MNNTSICLSFSLQLWSPYWQNWAWAFFIKAELKKIQVLYCSTIKACVNLKIAYPFCFCLLTLKTAKINNYFTHASRIHKLIFTCLANYDLRLVAIFALGSYYSAACCAEEPRPRLLLLGAKTHTLNAHVLFCSAACMRAFKQTAEASRQYDSNLQASGWRFSQQRAPLLHLFRECRGIISSELKSVHSAMFCGFCRRIAGIKNWRCSATLQKWQQLCSRTASRWVFLFWSGRHTCYTEARPLYIFFITSLFLWNITW